MKEVDIIICIKDFINVIGDTVQIDGKTVINKEISIIDDIGRIQTFSDTLSNYHFKDYFCTEAEFRSERLKKLLA